MRNMNTITIKQKIFTTGRLVMMRILTRKNWMGYYQILKETQITIRIKIKIIMNIQKKKLTIKI